MNQTKTMQLVDTAVVEQIHNDFFSAEERLIDAAEQLNSKKQKIIERQKRASLLGFSSSHQKVVEKVNEVSEVKRLIDYYREKYPLNKFITNEEVQRLCKKWKLVLGDAHRFVGEIPERNLQEIEKFNLKKEDWIDEENYYKPFFEIVVDRNPRFWGDSIGAVVREPKVTVRGGINYWADLRRFEDEYRQAMLGEPRRQRDHWGRQVGRARKQPAFKVVAPEKDFNTTGMMIRDNELVEAPVYDPIVLQPVKGGYLIVTAWGPEASDEIVINQIFN